MKLDDLINSKGEWLKAEGPEPGIAVSTRVRIARNAQGHAYFNRASDKQRTETLNLMIAAAKKNSFMKKALFLRMKDTSNLDRIFLVERHLISREHAQDVANKGLVVEDKEIISIMLNEEDHLRLQVLKSGFDIMEAWRIVDEVDTEMSRYMAFDFSSKFGYLTACPTNTGTGLRASVMLHLSALVMTNQIDNVFDAISKLGMTMRGFYGEGTEAFGDFFQISNQVAMGHSEMDILDNLERVVRKIIDREKSTRKELLRHRKEEMRERAERSFDTLKKVSIITSSETIKLLSAVRLGVDMGFIKGINMLDINEVMLLTQPAHLQKLEGREMGPHERDMKRSDFTKNRLANQ
jgi:protein arginine kinase